MTNKQLHILVFYYHALPVHLNVILQYLTLISNFNKCALIHILGIGATAAAAAAAAVGRNQEQTATAAAAMCRQDQDRMALIAFADGCQVRIRNCRYIDGMWIRGNRQPPVRKNMRWSYISSHYLYSLTDPF